MEGALAGGGDPATSPLYVFGPFLRLIVVAGVAQVTFGASVWMVVLTIAMVSAMYRLVMRWVTDGSGGSGLSEEEFGGWAVKVNAAITFIEYTLTFLVSMAAMVTFIADRIPLLNEKFLWIQYRTVVAILLSILTGWLVNRGPKMAARAFGPATAGVLLLLWAMVFYTIWKFGLRLPTFNLEAFRPEFLGFTVGGYVRILAVMTGIEVFANLVAAYDGDDTQKSNKAFNSLLIIMGTTAVTMVVVGPAIFQLSDPTNSEVSVFTQTMDQLLPAPLPWLGTLVGVAVLMSASAASAQGLQNLALGLKERNYIPPSLGKPNQFGVADKPAWIEVAIVSACFVLFGTHEETYLAIYAAGVFILLSMTGWAVFKRLLGQIRASFSVSTLGLMLGTALAALLTTLATVIIFEERFLEGAWTYLLFIPLLYVGFGYFRNRLGAPSTAMDNLGQFNAAQLAGFGFGQFETTLAIPGEGVLQTAEITWKPEPIEESHWRHERVDFRKIAVLLDGSAYAAQALPITRLLCKATGAELTLFSTVKNHTPALQSSYAETARQRETYLSALTTEFCNSGIQTVYAIRPGQVADAIADFVLEEDIDLVITSTTGKSGVRHWPSGGVSTKLMQRISRPVLLVPTAQDISHPNGEAYSIKRILVALDGSITSEGSLPYARALAQIFESQVYLLAVPEVPQTTEYRAPSEVLERLRSRAEIEMAKFLEAVARTIREDGIEVTPLVAGSLPARTILSMAAEREVDLIMMTTHGRGGLDLLFSGSVAQRVVANAESPVFMMPILPSE